MRAALISMLLMLAIIGQAFAQDSTQVTVTTDKKSYYAGDMVTISGKITPLPQTNTAVMQVYNTFNVMIQIGIVNVSGDGSFTTHVKAEGSEWKNNGTYTIRIIYSNPPINAAGSAQIAFNTMHNPTGTPTTAQSGQQPVQQPSVPQQSAQQPTPQQSSSQQPLPRQSVPKPQTSQPPTPASPSQQKQEPSVTATPQIMPQTVPHPVPMPFWAKDTARKWHDGLATGTDFGKVVQYMISSGLVKADQHVTSQDLFENTPSWVKDPAAWWSQGLVSDTEFATLVQFLLDHGIIKP